MSQFHWSKAIELKGSLSLVSLLTGARYLYIYTIFDQHRVDSINQVEYGVQDRLQITPCVGSLTSPGIDTR